MADQVMLKLQDHDKLFDKLDKRFEQVDKRFEQIDKRFEQIDNRFEQVDIKFDRLIKMVMDHEESIQDMKNTMATKSDIREIMDTLDKMVGMMQKRDQEMTFLGSRVERNEKQTEKNTKDIQMIKPILGLS